jgi:adenylate kinase
VPDELLIKGVVGRRLDPVAGAICHREFDPPNKQGVVARLMQRSDDTEEKVRTRLRAFYAHAKFINERYAPIISRIDGTRAKLDVFGEALHIIDAASDRRG